MPGIDRLDQRALRDLTERLKRIEGQARGIQRMVEEGRDCEQVLNQVAALKAATYSLSAVMLEQFALYCVAHPDDFGAPSEAISAMVGAVMRAGR